MIRNIKALALAFAAVCAMSAVAAVGAQAAQFTASGEYPAAGTGVQTVKHVFTVQGQKVECTGAHFAGTLAGASNDLTITPTYTGCTAFGIANASVDTSTCKYTMTVDGGTEPNYTGSVHVTCSSGSITVSAPASNPLCVVHIPAQTPTTNKIAYTDTANGTVHVKSEVGGIHSTVTDLGGFFCPLSNAETDTTGTYTGSVAFKATEAGKKAHIG